MTVGTYGTVGLRNYLRYLRYRRYLLRYGTVGTVPAISPKMISSATGGDAGNVMKLLAKAAHVRLPAGPPERALHDAVVYLSFTILVSFILVKYPDRIGLLRYRR